MTEKEENYLIFRTLLKEMKAAGSVMEGGKVCAFWVDRYSARKTSISVRFFASVDSSKEEEILASLCENYNEISGRFGFFDIPAGRYPYKEKDLSDEGKKKLEAFRKQIFGEVAVQ